MMGAMALVLALCAQLLAGGLGLFLAAGLLLGGVVFLPKAARAAIMRMLRAVAADDASLQPLRREVRDLSTLAGLRAAPRLWLVPRATVAAFSVGTPDNAGIGVSHSLLDQLDGLEVRGILAHEISHIAAGDITLLTLSAVVGRLTRGLAAAGLLAAGLTVLFGMRTFPASSLLVLLAAPVAVSLLQLALSRNREFDADQSAAELTGDPEGLASALCKIEHGQRSFLGRMFGARTRTVPVLFRTHPRTRDRIARLIGSG